MVITSVLSRWPLACMSFCAMREASALVHISCGYHSLLRCKEYYATTHGGLQR